MDARKDSAEAEPHELAMTLDWTAKDGRLVGALTVRNVGQRRVRITGKPRVTPLDDDDRPLPTQHIISTELRRPGYVELAFGEQARAPLFWAAWDGTPASGRAMITLRGGRREIRVSGPHQPTSGAGPTNTSSSWFERMG